MLLSAAQPFDKTRATHCFLPLEAREVFGGAAMALGLSFKVAAREGSPHTPCEAARRLLTRSVRTTFLHAAAFVEVLRSLAGRTVAWDGVVVFMVGRLFTNALRAGLCLLI